jgi:hypothetical protein
MDGGPPDSSDLAIGNSISPAMNFALVLAIVFLSSSAIASHGVVHQHRRTELTAHDTRQYGGWCQAPSGSASFTAYTNCSVPCKLYVLYVTV